MFNDDWYSDNQVDNLKNLYKTVKNLEGLVIEIGCWEGKSTYNLANECYPETLICNDTWLGNQMESQITGNKHITEIILESRDVFSIFKTNMNTLTKGNYKIVKEDCLKWLKTINEPIKFCHIDASHEYQSVYDAIQLLKPHIVKGGIICGDDFLNASLDRADLQGGVERAVIESFSNYKNIDNLWYWYNIV